MSQPAEMIVWWDHANCAANGPWISRAELDELDGPVVCVSVGFVVRENTDALYMTNTVTADDDRDTIATPFLIVKSCIRSRIVLGEGSKRWAKRTNLGPFPEPLTP